MKNIILHIVILMLVSVMPTSAQVPFNTTSLDSFNSPNDDYITNVFMISGDEMILTGGRLDGNASTYPFLLPTVNIWKTDADGNLKDYLEFSTYKHTPRNTVLPTVVLYNVNNVFEEGSDFILIGNGMQKSDSLPCIVYIKTDHDFKILTVNTFTINTPPGMYGAKDYGMSCKPHPDGGYYGAMTIITYVGAPYHYKYFFKINAQGTPPIKGSLIPITGIYYDYKRPTNLEYSTSLHQYKSMDISQQYYLLDEDLQLIKKDSTTLPETTVGNDGIVRGYQAYPGANNIRPYGNGHIIAGVMRFNVSYDFGTGASYDRPLVCVKKLDDAFNIIKTTNIWQDTLTAPGSPAVTNFDFINEDTIFFVNTLTLPPAFGDTAGSYLQSYTVFQTNGYFSVRWSRTFHIPFVRIQSIKATPDGGCILVGNVTSKPNDPHTEAQLFISKLTNKGNIASVNYISKNSMEKITVYPNPGDDMIYLNGGLKDFIFTLYDMQGRKVRIIHCANFSKLPINVEYLTPGIYFYTITDNNTDVITKGKWVKQ